MAPDFEYFARGKLLGTFAHSWPGFILWGVPITLFVAATYHYSLKWLFLLTSPRWIARRTTSILCRPWQEQWNTGTMLLLAVSAALGNLTHVVWDGFTHASGWPVRTYPILESKVLLPGGSIRLYRLLQHGSTVVGLAALLISLGLLLRSQTKIEVPKARSRWLVIALVVAGVMMMNARLHVLGVSGLGHTVVATIAGVLVGSLAATAALARTIRGLRCIVPKEGER